MSYLRPLLATDLSRDAGEAARLAPHVLAPGYKGTAVMAVQPPDLPSDMPPDVMDELIEMVELNARDAEGTLRGWLQSLGLLGWDAVALSTGGVAGAIAREAERVAADVVIVGHRGVGRVERVLLGSIARSVLRRVAADVLVARPRTAGALKRILVATDLQEPSVAAIRRAMALAEQNHAEIVLIHVLDPGLAASVFQPYPPAGSFDGAWLRKHVEDHLARLNAEHLKGRATVVLLEGRAASRIVEHAAAVQADLVIVGTHGGGAVSRVLIGSVAEAVVERAASSVLVVRP